VIALLHASGYTVHVATLSWPNAAQWHLAAAIDALFLAVKQKIFLGRRDGRGARSIHDPKRRFPNLVGMIGTLEAPLSRLAARDPSNAWNVHIHAIMIFKGRADYGRMRAIWGAHFHIERLEVKSREAFHKALAELVKYPMKAIADKSSDARHADRDAPPMVEWPADYFDEWWRAHRGFKRTRAWGELYTTKAAVARRSLEHVDWLGSWRFVHDRFVVSFPLPPAARDRGLTLIQGTFFTSRSGTPMNGGSARGSGPPH
jgi:hypothetical protein